MKSSTITAVLLPVLTSTSPASPVPPHNFPSSRTPPASAPSFPGSDSTPPGQGTTSSLPHLHLPPQDVLFPVKGFPKLGWASPMRLMIDMDAEGDGNLLWTENTARLQKGGEGH